MSGDKQRPLTTTVRVGALGPAPAEGPVSVTGITESSRSPPEMQLSWPPAYRTTSKAVRLGDLNEGFRELRRVVAPIPSPLCSQPPASFSLD